MKKIQTVPTLWLLVAGLLALNTALAVPPPPGVAPVGPPPGGFDIDGNLLANTPTADIGDWVVNTNLAPGTGLSVLNPAGVPLDPARTFHFVDPYNDTSNDRIFTGGDKWLDDPNTWGWANSKPSSKTDINNALMHLATDTNGHVWAIIAADRLSTSGDSYIDFEFLQSLLTRNANGTFSSAGTNGGRTTNDILLSLAFTGGGKVADFLAWRWVPAGGGIFTYTNITSVLPAGGVFVALNSNNIVTPYDAFGAMTYAPNAFAEAAIDLTALLGNFNQCESFGFKTIMIKTKASASSSAGIEDFIDPIQYNLSIGPSANAGPDQARCTEGVETVFALNGSTASGLQPIASNLWTVVSGSVTIDDPNVLATAARVSSASATLRLTVYQINGCSKSDDIVLHVQQPPVCAITGPATICPRTTNTFSAPANMSQYSWSVSGNGFISGATNQATVKVVAGAGCGESYSVALITRSNVCTVACATEVMVTDTAPPVLTCPPDRLLDCPANTSTNATGVATATDSCSRVTVTYSDAVTNGCGATKVIARTWTATDECGNAVSCTQTITVRDITSPVITCAPSVTRECGDDTTPAGTGTATATDACSGTTVNFSDAIAPLCPGSQIITRTWTAIDACGNQASCQQTITVRDTTPPTIAANIVCSFSADDLAGSAADLLATNYAGLFPQGLALGVYAPSNNTSPPNGLFWQPDNAGLTALQIALGVSGSSGAITEDALNSAATFGAGELGRQALALSVNIAFNKAGLVGAGPNNFAELIYTQAGDSLSGKSVKEILAAANAALAGLGLPAGQNFASLATLLNNLNVAFQNCTASTFAKTRLGVPAVVLSCGSQIPPPNFSLIVAADSCSSATISGLPQIVTNQTCANRLTLIRSWRATDACGNSATVAMSIIVNDTAAPVISCPPDVTLEHPANLSPTNTGTATGTDNCGSPAISFNDTVTNTCGVGRVVLRTWAAIDSCLNVATCVQTITIRDTTPPGITCPPNATVECGGSTLPAATGTPTATDLSGSYSITNADSITPGCGGSFTISRRWTAFDACGNAASCTQTITVRDTTAPAITCPANRTLECPADISTNNTGVATATDICSAVVVTYSDTSATVCGNARIISRTWRATDACGNSSTCVQTLTIRDTTPPMLTIPINATVECGGSVATSATGNATATDACNAFTITFSDSVSNSCGNARMILRRWVAMDSCNNSNVAVQTITVRDTTPPVLTLPANRTLNCPGDTRTNNTGVATATDVCGAVTISYSEVVTNSCGITKTIWRTWTAVDQCGNAANGLQTIIVQDTAPTMSCPSVSVQCVGDVPPPYPNIAAFRAAGGVANDACDADLDFVLVSNSVLVGSCPARMTRVYRVTDDCGLTAQCAQTVIVDDTIAPTLTCPPSVTVECGASVDTNTLGSATATDNCSAVVITRTDVPVGSTYNLKWYGSDPDLGTGPYSPTYLRLGPASLPRPTGGRAIDPLRNAVCYAPGGQLDALTSLGGVPLAFGQIVPFQLVIEVGGAPGAEKGVIEVTPSWSTHTTSNDRFGFDTNYMVYCAFVDPADPGSIDPHFNAKVDLLNSYLFDRGTINEQIRGTLQISGLDSGDRIIVEIWMVMQTTQPNQVGGTIASELTGARKLSIPAEDITIGNETISIGNLSKFTTLPPAQPQPPAPPIPPQPPVPPGATVSVIDRTWAATDDCGNRSTCVQRITVRDTTAPSLTAPDLVLECPADTSTNSTGMATVSDGCGLVTLGYSDVVSNSCGNTRTILRTWTAHDDNQNTNSVVQTIIVADTTAPTLSLVNPKSISAGVAIVFDAPNATDLCGSASVVEVSTVTNALTGGSYTITQTWVAVDACGNKSASQAQVVTVNALVIAPLNRLVISRNGSSGVLLRWPTNAVDYRLECSTTPDAKRWNAVPVTPIVTNGECRVYLPKVGHCQLFRLANTPPYLESAKAGGGNLRLTWPTAPSGFQLEASDSMATGSWLPVAIVPGVSNTLNHVTVPSTGTKKFYRLKK